MSRDENDYGERAEAVLSIFRRGADFTRDLMQENSRLRERINSVESRQHQAAQDPEDWEKLRIELLTRIDTLEDENRNILEKLRAVETENHQFANRYVEVEEENNNLANLYVASYQLHSTLDPAEVLKVIVEIVINLIGAEIFAIYLNDEKDGVMTPVASEGREVGTFPRIPIDTSSLVGRSTMAGEVGFADLGNAGNDGFTPVVSIPLRVEDRSVGAIAIHRLLTQKDGFSALDQELFTLLAGHAATAVFASQLYSQSERKRNTIQGFIDLLTK